MGPSRVAFVSEGTRHHLEKSSDKALTEASDGSMDHAKRSFPPQKCPSHEAKRVKQGDQNGAASPERRTEMGTEVRHGARADIASDVCQNESGRVQG